MGVATYVLLIKTHLLQHSINYIKVLISRVWGLLSANYNVKHERRFIHIVSSETFVNRQQTEDIVDNDRPCHQLLLFLIDILISRVSVRSGPDSCHIGTGPRRPNTNSRLC